MSGLYLDTLDKDRREVFSCLAEFAGIGVLGDGTAIALQVGHRRSFDFDIFTVDPLSTTLWSKVRRIFGPGCVRTVKIGGQLDFLTPDNISITFFHDEYPFLFPAVKTSTISLMNLRDLASNKAFVIGRRGKWRDYVDLYFLLKEGHTTITEIVETSQKRSQKEFPIRLFLEQLSYFGDIEDYTIDFVRETISSSAIKEYLMNEVKKFEVGSGIAAIS